MLKMSRNELIKYLMRNYKISRNEAERKIDNGVDNITFANIKYLGFDIFIVNKSITNLYRRSDEYEKQ